MYLSRRNSVFVSGLLLLLSIVTAEKSAAAGLFAHCSPTDERRKVLCDLRLPDPLSRPRIDSVGVEWTPSGATDTANYVPFDQARNNVAFLILVDRTTSMRTGKGKADKTLPALTADLKRLIASAADNHLIGIATLDEEFNSLAAIGSSRTTLEGAVDKINLNGGSAELYRNSLKAVNALAEYPSVARRALIIVSDGGSDEVNTEVARARVVKRAKETGIVIYGLGYKNPARVQDMARLEDLANETNGPYALVSDERKMAGEFLDAFFGHMTYGGTAEFPLRKSTETVAPKFQVFATVGTQTVSTDASLAEPVTGGMLQGLSDWWYLLDTTTKTLYLVAGLALLLASIVAIWLLRRTRGSRSDRDPITQDPFTGGISVNPTEPLLAGASAAGGSFGTAPQSFGAASSFSGISNAATRVLDQSGGNTYAWLERTDTGEKLLINKTTVGIGRHDDNDLRIREDSVHRRHANIHMTPQREFVVTDLSPQGGNDVKVNSIKVSNQKTIRDGDIVELGAVRMKFVVATV